MSSDIIFPFRNFPVTPGCTKSSWSNCWEVKLEIKISVMISHFIDIVFLCLSLPIVLSTQAALTNCHRLTYAIDIDICHRHREIYFSQLWRLGSPKSRHQAIQFPVKSLFLDHSSLSSHCILLQQEKISHLSHGPSYKDTNPIHKDSTSCPYYYSKDQL